MIPSILVACSQIAGTLAATQVEVVYRATGAPYTAPDPLNECAMDTLAGPGRGIPRCRPLPGAARHEKRVT